MPPDNKANSGVGNCYHNSSSHQQAGSLAHPDPGLYEKVIHQLQEENEQLKSELAAQRAEQARTILALEKEHEERLYSEAAFANRLEHEGRFRALLNQVPAVVWESRLDPETMAITLAFVSDYVETLLGYSKEELTENPELWFERIHPDDREQAKRRIAEIFFHDDSGEEQFRWIAKDGRTVWVETSKRVVRDEHGMPVGLRGVNIDITARKRAEEERETVEGRFQAFMDHSPVVALIKDDEGRIVYGNRRFREWCESLGLDWFGATDFDLFPEEYASRYVRHDQEAMQRDTPVEKLEVSYNQEGAPEYWAVLRFPMRDARGRRALGFVAMDVSERRRLEKEILEISDREQQRFGQELHDGLCQHLLGLALMSNNLVKRMKKGGMVEAESVQAINDFLYEALGLARGLIQGFHLVNVETAGGLPSALEEFCSTTSRLFGKTCRARSDVTLEVTDQDVGRHLFRIAQEAVHNAIKHGRPNDVLVSLERDGETVVLKVENDGTRLPDSMHRSKGMGIRTMKYRAELIGADLRLENRPRGDGVVMTCRIPAGRGIEIVS